MVLRSYTTLACPITNKQTFETLRGKFFLILACHPRVVALSPVGTHKNCARLVAQLCSQAGVKVLAAIPEQSDATRTPDCCLLTAYLLPTYCLLTAYTYCLLTAYLLPTYCLLTAYLLPTYCLLTADCTYSTFIFSCTVYRACLLRHIRLEVQLKAWSFPASSMSVLFLINTRVFTNESVFNKTGF